MPEFPAMNLPNALDVEVQSIDQLMRNVTYLYNYPYWISGPAWGGYHSEWPEPDRIRYHISQAVWIELRNVHVKEYGPIQWQDADTLGGRHRDIVEEQDVVIPIDQGTWEKEVSLTFSSTRGLEDATKRGFTSEAMAKLGGINAPASASINQKVELEFAQTFSKEQTESYTVRDKISLPTPLNITYRGERERVVEQRRSLSTPVWDYGIALRYEYNEGSWTEMYFASKQQFVDFIRGNAPDSVGVYEVGGLSAYNIWEGKRIPVDGRSEPQAAWFRAHPQPEASLAYSPTALEWAEPYDNASRGRLVVVDHLNGDKDITDG